MDYLGVKQEVRAKASMLHDVKLSFLDALYMESGIFSIADTWTLFVLIAVDSLLVEQSQASAGRDRSSANY